jgi:hypothetical protein
MKKILVLLFGVFLLLPLAGVAQDFPALTVKADIPFQFNAGGTMLPAGPYEFQIEGNDLDWVKVTDTKTNESIYMPILAYVNGKSLDESNVVFDASGKSYRLSEIFVPGENGFMVAAMHGRHANVGMHH